VSAIASNSRRSRAAFSHIGTDLVAQNWKVSGLAWTSYSMIVSAFSFGTKTARVRAMTLDVPRASIWIALAQILSNDLGVFQLFVGKHERPPINPSCIGSCSNHRHHQKQSRARCQARVVPL
jgi:hypothetical protein